MVRAVVMSLVTVASAMTCPGSGAFLTHASMQITATADADCDTVKAEMASRVAGENGC